MGCLSCFIYGAYVYGSVHDNRIPELHQWVITAFFGIMFMCIGFGSLKKIWKNEEK